MLECRKLDHLLERLSHEQLEVQARFEHQCNEAVAASQASAEQMRQEFIKEREKLESELKVIFLSLYGCLLKEAPFFHCRVLRLSFGFGYTMLRRVNATATW